MLIHYYQGSHMVYEPTARHGDFQWHTIDQAELIAVGR